MGTFINTGYVHILNMVMHDSRKLLLMILIPVLLILILFGYYASISPTDRPDLVPPGVPTDALIKSVTLLDKNIIRDSDGLPISVRVVSDITLSGEENTQIDYSCKLTYDGNIIGDGTNRQEIIDATKEMTSRVTLTEPVEGKLDVGKWDICCDMASLTIKTTTTVCSGEDL